METHSARQKIFSIPNALSVVRICLIPVFVVCYFSTSNENGWGWVAALVLVISSATDIIDGIIARRFGMVTAVGEILDPIADKLTQVTVCVCLLTTYPRFAWLLLIFIVKETLMIVGGARLLRKGLKPGAARWYGKLGTVVFYIVMILVIATRPLPEIAMRLMVVALAFMLFSFFMYLRTYIGKLKKQR